MMNLVTLMSWITRNALLAISLIPIEASSLGHACSIYGTKHNLKC